MFPGIEWTGREEEKGEGEGEKGKSDDEPAVGADGVEYEFVVCALPDFECDCVVIEKARFGEDLSCDFALVFPAEESLADLVVFDGDLSLEPCPSFDGGAFDAFVDFPGPAFLEGVVVFELSFELGEAVVEDAFVPPACPALSLLCSFVSVAGGAVDVESVVGVCVGSEVEERQVLLAVLSRTELEVFSCHLCFLPVVPLNMGEVVGVVFGSEPGAEGRCGEHAFASGAWSSPVWVHERVCESLLLACVVLVELVALLLTVFVFVVSYLGWIDVPFVPPESLPVFLTFLHCFSFLLVLLPSLELDEKIVRLKNSNSLVWFHLSSESSSESEETRSSSSEEEVSCVGRSLISSCILGACELCDAVPCFPSELSSLSSGKARSSSSSSSRDRCILVADSFRTSSMLL